MPYGNYVNSNSFVFELDTKQESSPAKNAPEDSIDIKRKGKVIQIDEIIENKSSNPPFLEDMQHVLHSTTLNNEIKFQEILLNKDNFSKYHFDLMNNTKIVVMYDNDKNVYKYMTPKGTVYISSDSEITNIIQSVPRPSKISIGYVPKVSTETVLSLNAFTFTIFNKYSANDIQTVQLYLKPGVATPELTNVSDAYKYYYSLFSIFGKLEYYLNLHKCKDYMFMEQKIYDIYNTSNSSVFNHINIDTLAEMKDNCMSDITNLLNSLKIDPTAIDSKENLLNYIYTNLEIYPTLDKKILKLLGYSDLINLIEDIEMLNFINDITKNNGFSCINLNEDTDKEPLSVNITNKVLIRGSYTDMFFKIFASLSHKSSITSKCNNSMLINNLLAENMQENENTELYGCYLEYYIKAMLAGCKTDDEILDYFKTSLYTIFAKEDLDPIKKIYENELSIINEVINKYKPLQYNNYAKFVSNPKLDPLLIDIYSKKSLIFKTLIEEISLYCKDFNAKNKSKIDIFYFDSDNIYICCDESAENVAFDTLSRIMPQIFSKYCNYVPPICYVDIIGKK